MKPQIPAEGILKSGDWSSSRSYQVVCGCGQPDHAHTVWIDAEDIGVNVNIYVNVKSPFWSMNRWRQMWSLMTKGYLEHETTITMSEQQALNYSETLKTAITDVKTFKEAQNGNKKTKTRTN